MTGYFGKDFYKTLGISPNANEEEIKSAFRKLARQYHPDVNKDEQSIETFKKINEAYEILSDKKEKERYDNLNGYSKPNQSEQTQAKKAYNSQTQKRTYSPPPNVKKEANRTSNKKNKESFSKVFNDILEGLFEPNENEKQKTKQLPPENGSNITMHLKISQYEAVSGTNRKVNILHTEKCPNCQGKKFINGAECTYCKGKGEISLHKKINVKIPAGVIQDSKIRIANEGTKGLRGGKNGDLYLIIDLENDNLFKYEGNNVVCEIPITPFEAALGTTIEVPTIDGKVTMKIPPLTSSGQKFRLAKEGLFDKSSSQKGDQVVIVKIELPKSLSIEEIKLYEQLKSISREDVRKNLKNAK